MKFKSLKINLRINITRLHNTPSQAHRKSSHEFANKIRKSWFWKGLAKHIYNLLSRKDSWWSYLPPFPGRSDSWWLDTLSSCEILDLPIDIVPPYYHTSYVVPVEWKFRFLSTRIKSKVFWSDIGEALVFRLCSWACYEALLLWQPSDNITS